MLETKEQICKMLFEQAKKCNTNGGALLLSVKRFIETDGNETSFEGMNSLSDVADFIASTRTESSIEATLLSDEFIEKLAQKVYKKFYDTPIESFVAIPDKD